MNSGKHELQAEIKELTRKLKKMEVLFRAIGNAASVGAEQSLSKMDDGIGRAEWAWHKGRLLLANEILTLLGQSSVIVPAKRVFFKKLFN